MDAGIQSQGCEILSGTAAEIRHNGIALLPSMALDTGIPAGMTAVAELGIGLRYRYPERPC
jgi:hypothetical protein